MTLEADLTLEAEPQPVRLDPALVADLPLVALQGSHDASRTTYMKDGRLARVTVARKARCRRR